jgi:hypothetical protein
MLKAPVVSPTVCAQKKRVLARRDKNPPSWLSERGFPSPETHSRSERIELSEPRTLGSGAQRGSAGIIEPGIVQRE